MSLIFLLASIACGIGSLICTILIYIHAFQKGILYGLLCVFIPCYLLYYMFAEFQHPSKGLVIAGSLFGSSLSLALRRMA